MSGETYPATGGQPRQPDVRVDAVGLKCPLPIIELGKAANLLDSGLIELISDDPVALQDVPAWCRMRSAALLDQATDGHGVSVFIVRVG